MFPLVLKCRQGLAAIYLFGMMSLMKLSGNGIKTVDNILTGDCNKGEDMIGYLREFGKEFTKEFGKEFVKEFGKECVSESCSRKFEKTKKNLQHKGNKSY